MPNHLSTLGIIHTIISILAIIVAFIALFRFGIIDPRTSAGRWYVILTALTCLTAFGIMKTGKLTPGHGLSALVLLLLVLGIYARRLFGARGQKTGIILLSTTLFLSFIPAITETLTRIPISHPIAESPDASVVKTSYLVLLVVFAVGLYFQLRKPKPTVH
ncbi:MAG TPA: hypothetical protein VNW04_07880 [Puia sp.]|jgi:hypothetical protein|nr:hypothetical protein [Puia sp.]